MKMSPEYTKAQENMQPGVITSDGFLGDDTRNIVDIIEADEEEFSRLGMDFDEVVGILRRLLEEGRKGLGEPVTIDGKWIVTTTEARGHLASPFEDGIYRKVNALIEHAPGGTPDGTSLLVSDLSLHLMEKNHFLQGKGASFRIDPETVKKVLEL
tara:strand:- start:806 stop:1270 length:465 start_codon:yes stop_codon:yes gene_type:complete